MSMSLMDAVVAYQMGGRAPLPPVPQIIADAEARIAGRQERLARITATVTAALSKQSEAEISGLEDCMLDLRTDDPTAAVTPQSENITQMLSDMKVITGRTLGAVVQTDHQLAQRVQENIALKNELKNLRSKLPAAQNAQIKNFLQECSQKGSSYAAK